MNIISPIDKNLLKTVEEDNQISLEEKFKLAKIAQKNWAKVSIDDRISIIKKFWELLDSEKELLAKDLTLEMGKPISESFSELDGARYRTDYFLNHVKDFLTVREVHDDGTTKEELSWEPLGVVGNISAWNYPYLVGVNVFVPALLTGNAVLYKPSEFTTLTGLHIANLLEKAGLPKNLFLPIIGAGNVGKELLNLPLDGVFFTGSYQTGKSIAQTVAPKLIPVGLELGGKDPLYVMDDDPNIATLAENAVGGAFYNNGQSCCAIERIYVHESVYEQFVSNFVEHVKKLKMGNPLDKETQVGPIARKEHLDFLQSQVDDAVSKGAKVLIGGSKATDTKGYYYNPTVLINVNHSMQVMTDETFGPVIGIQKVKDDSEAVELMNDTPYGLTAAVFGRSKERAKAILDQLQVGNTYFNCSDRVSPYLPWTGVRNSGLGSTLSKLGIQAFVHPKGHHWR